MLHCRSWRTRSSSKLCFVLFSISTLGWYNVQHIKNHFYFCCSMPFSKGILQLLHRGNRRSWTAVCSNLFKPGQWWLCELFLPLCLWYLDLLYMSWIKWWAVYCGCNTWCIVTTVYTNTKEQWFITVPSNVLAFYHCDPTIFPGIHRVWIRLSVSSWASWWWQRFLC